MSDESSGSPSHDPMLDRVAQLPDQLAASPAILDAASLPRPKGVSRVLICGMGGSAAAADLARGVFADAPVSIDVLRDYRLPGWVSEGTLLIFSSYSGNTEELLSAYDQAHEQHPGLDRYVISSGGRLGELAARDQLAHMVLPGGSPPRAALGFGVGVLFGLLDRLGILQGAEEQLVEAVELLREGNAELGPAASQGDNRARRLARRLYGKLPVIYAASGMTEAVAQRWRAQLNENAKTLAHVAALPELDHNEIVGWEVGTPIRDGAHVIALRDHEDHPRIQRRFEYTRETLGDRLRSWEAVQSQGISATARALSLVQFGDYLSVYLAEEYGVDATAVDAIERLKKRLEDQS